MRVDREEEERMGGAVVRMQRNGVFVQRAPHSLQCALCLISGGTVMLKRRWGRNAA
jgi:hypothetical protein